MKSVSLLIAFQLLGAAFGAIFVDDLGVSHTLSKDSKFVAWSNIAVTLHQLGTKTRRHFLSRLLSVPIRCSLFTMSHSAFRL